MRRKFTTLVLFLVLMAQGVYGQTFSGTYYVGNNGTAPGGVDPHYPTLKAAFDALMDSEGVTGNLTFLITSNIEETQNVFLGIDPGVYNVTIKPNIGVEPVVTFSSISSNNNINGALVIGAMGDDTALLTVTRNITIDGSNTIGGTTRDLTLRVAANANESNYFRIAGSVIDSRIINTNLETLNNSFDVVFISAMEPADVPLFPENFELRNNSIIGNPNRTTGRAINIWGQLSPTIGARNTIIIDNDIEARRYGIWLRVAAESTNIDSNKIKITESSNVFAYGVLIDDVVNQNDEILIVNNEISESSSSNTIVGVRASSTANYRIENNLFEDLRSDGGITRGIWVDSSGDFEIKGNIFSNFYGLNGVRKIEVRNNTSNLLIQNNQFVDSISDTGECCVTGIFASSAANYKILDNTFENIESSGTVFGINMTSPGHYDILGNTFSNFKGDGGIEMISLLGLLNGNVTGTISNNFLTGFASGASSGQSLFGIIIRTPATPNTANFNIHNNTIKLNHLSAISGSGWLYRALSIFSNERITIDLKNNIVVNNDNNGSAVTSFAYYQFGTATILTSDYNNLFVANPSTANTFLGRFSGSGGTNIQDLATWQSETGRDLNSVSKAVTFVNAAAGNLRLTGASNGDSDLAGTPLSTVTTDIDGEPRNPNNPYMGAFEGRPLSPMVVIRGSQGWRFMSSPTNQTYAALLDPIWTQGATGSNHPESQQPNVFRYDPTVTENDGYVPISDLEVGITPGSGFVIYVFDKNDLDDEASAVWPKVLALTGTENSGTVNPTIFNGSETFSLVGNPFFSTLEFGGLTRTLVENQVFVYSHNFTGPFNQGLDNEAVGGGGWRTWNGSVGSLTDGHIAPFQAFFVKNVENPDGTPSLTIPESAKVEDETTFYNLNSQNSSIQIAGRINQRQQADSWLGFTDQGSVNSNEADLTALYPLDYEPFLFMFIENEGRALNIKNLPTELAESIHLPLHINAWKPNGSTSAPGFIPMQGTVELIWPVFENIPAEWGVFLHDTNTGNTLDMKESSGYVFEMDVAKQNKTLPYRFGMHSPNLSDKFASRFSIEIIPQTTDLIPGNELPKVVTLSQNYPNPFNPTTQITYELPQSAEVRLDVFNVMGQRVATLINASQNAGSHTVTFDARNLASGVYMYRLQAGTTVLTRKMTLVK